MQRRKLEKLFQKNGWYLLMNGGNHDIWTNDKEKEQLPRHPEIKETLAKGLKKKHNLK